MTHDEKVLALLSDGKPHTHHEIYGLGVVGHSRVASLRAKGYTIPRWRDGDDYVYQLTGSPLEEAHAEPSAACVSSSGPGIDRPDVPPGDGGQAAGAAQQLSVWDALAA